MIRRIRCQFKGLVQGVGFRPFIFRAAQSRGLTGFVLNSTDGVLLEVQGADPAVREFLAHITHSPPALADITGHRCQDIDPVEETGFSIRESRSRGALDACSPPDSAICEDCLRELFDPANRRFGYPFINCTNCGPRLTIVQDLPYDRDKTSMACFPLCPDCRKEYDSPADRRFHAEPNACPVCGPRLWLLDAAGKKLRCDDPIALAADKLKAGLIGAIKGLGGFHLAVDAESDAAVRRLRERKCREEKPLAIMVRDRAMARDLVETDLQHERLLASPQRPIVLAAKKKHGLLSELVAPRMNRLGIMLAYAPLHYLLFEKGFAALVMTSANRTDEPICTGNREAVQRLRGIADFYLVHDRDILVRCDDSIAMVAAGKPRLLRRARGFVPRPVPLAKPCPGILALGPHLKSTVCIVKGREAFLSPHIGDMETPQAREFLHDSIRLMQNITDCRPDIVACDLHPGYHTSAVAAGMQAKQVEKVQHHHAHIASCMAENGLAGQVIGLAMDGTGYGTDGTIWGGEFLIADEAAFVRAGHLRQFMLPGSAAAIREPWRIGASLLREAFGHAWQAVAAKLALAPQPEQYGRIEKMMAAGVNSPVTSSLGRLFDGVAAILGIRAQVSFEGQAAMELEAAAESAEGERHAYSLENGGSALELNFTPALRALTEQKLQGRSASCLARAFHTTLIHAFIAAAEHIRSVTGLNRTVLSGGCFQNRLLFEGCSAGLAGAGFEVYSHQLVPTNDGGISLGQAFVAAARHG